MSLFQLKERWRYWRTARGRHGTHSPFVYHFVEKGLKPSLPEAIVNHLERSAASLYDFKQAKTIYRCQHFLTDHASCIFLEVPTEEIARLFEEKAPLLQKGCCFIIKDIHRAPGRAAVWRKLARDPRVNLSIDLWYIGLLFFRPEFKERQHFVLKHFA